MSNRLFDARQKILRRDELAADVSRRQQAGERGVFTNGIFDLLHLGHVRYLQEARALGDLLVVGLNDDQSTRQLKGSERPLVPLEERTVVLAALESVDLVVPFCEETAEALVTELRPD